ncbi:uncharacterized protein LOC143378686 isoform X2 [Andrena cerasifolii]|uniref:uncharacterized protein LOC143378686 isoform X2 n=1 Tax=Andrena cerasifolii TaxID=2819439 RepID=UPI00403839B6
MGLSDLETIPETGAVFTIGRSRFADNIASHFFIRKDSVIAITCGDEHSAVICQTGRLFVFGSNDWGQLGLGHKNHISKPSCVKILKPERVTHVACGRAHTLICTGSQKIFACGSDQEGQLGRGTSAIGDSSSSPVLVYDSGRAGSKIVQIAAGSHHSLALTSDGRVFAWGSNLEGQLGLPDVSGLVNKPTKVHIPEPVKQISTGYYHSTFLTESGLVYVCGESESGKLGIDVNFSTQAAPKQMQLPSPAVHVACGGHHTIILAENGNLYCTGSNSSGQLGLGTNVAELHTPKLLPRGALQDERVTQIACGESHTAIVTESGKLFTCGDGRHGKLGLEENENNVHELTFAPRYKGLFVSNVACGGCHTILVAQRYKREMETTQTENSQKINSLPPLKLPVNKLQSDVREEKVHAKEIQQLNGEHESAEMTTATAPSSTIEATIENATSKQDTVTNNVTDSMNNIKKPDSPGGSPKVTPKKISSTVESNEVPSEATSEEVPLSADQPQGSNVMNGNKEEEDDNEKPSMKVDAENNVQEVNKPEVTNGEQDDKEHNNEMAKDEANNNTEPKEQTNEENDTMDNKENDDEEDRAKAMNKEIMANESAKEEASPEKQTSPSGSTPPPKPPRLKPGSGNNSPTERAQSIEKEDENVDASIAEMKTMPGKLEAADSNESIQKQGSVSTKSSTKSVSSRSTRSKVDMKEAIEIDRENDKDKVIEQHVNNENAHDDADVVQSPAPRTGKMSKMFKGKRQQAVENGTKATSSVNHKPKSKTCAIL